MTKTTVYLDADTVLSLRRLSEAQQRPQAELIREALAQYSKGSRRPTPKGIGRFRSGRRDVSSRARELLRGAVRDGRWP